MKISIDTQDIETLTKEEVIVILPKLLWRWAELNGPKYFNLEPRGPGIEGDEVTRKLQFEQNKLLESEWKEKWNRTLIEIGLGKYIKDVK